MIYVFSFISQKIFPAKVSYCQNSDIREVSTVIYCCILLNPAISNNRDIRYNS